MFNKIKKSLSKSKIDFIQSFGKLELKDGDILVLKSPRTLSGEETTNLKISLKTYLEKLPIKVRMIILEDGMDVGILRLKISGDAQEKT